MARVSLNKKNRVRLIDIANLAGVSKVAVSKALFGTGGNTRVGPDTALKIRKIAKELNYRPNVAARQLAGKGSKLIGAIVDSCAAQLFFEYLSGIERAVAEKGYHFLVGQSHGEISRISNYADEFMDRGIDGIVCVSHDYPLHGDKVSSIFSHFKNVVFIGRPQNSKGRLSYVGVDMSQGIKDAVEYLYRNSRRRIGIMLGRSGSYSMRMRYDGYVKTLNLLNLPMDPALINWLQYEEDMGDLRRDDIVQSVLSLAGEGQVDAIIAPNDRVAAVAIKGLMNNKYKVPEDIAVVGSDNLELAEFCEIPITTIDQCSKEVTNAVVDMLLDFIEGRRSQENTKPIIIKPKLIIRESA